MRARRATDQLPHTAPQVQKVPTTPATHVQTQGGCAITLCVTGVMCMCECVCVNVMCVCVTYSGCCCVMVVVVDDDDVVVVVVL